MSKKPKWAEKLTKEEIKHLKELGEFTLKGAVEMAKFQKNKDVLNRCHTCHSIGKKLGVI